MCLSSTRSVLPAFQEHNVTRDANIYGMHAMAHVDNDGAGAISFDAQRGFSGLVRNGVGDVTLTFNNELDINHGVVSLTVKDTTGGGQRGNITVQKVNNSQIRVRTFTGGVAADSHFYIIVWEMGPD